MSNDERQKFWDAWNKCDGFLHWRKPPKVVTEKTERQLKAEYRKEVWRLTEQVAHLIPGIETRGWKQYNVDHIYPIAAGYKNGIPAELIADIKNLRMLHQSLNEQKNRKVRRIPKHIAVFLRNSVSSTTENQNQV